MAKKVVYRGKTYRSLSELAQEKGVRLDNLSRRISKGMSVEEAVDSGISVTISGKKLEYNGKEYKSVVELAKVAQVGYGTLKARLLSGMSVEEAVETKKDSRKQAQKIEYMGKEYPSMKRLAEEVGIKYSVFYERVKRGMSVEEAVRRGEKEWERK